MKFVVNTLDALDEAAKTLTSFSNDTNVFAFYGPMGAGKTTLIKRVCYFLGVTDTVNSPTFSIVNAYHTIDNTTVYHFDFYRINRLEEAFDIGYENYFYSQSLCLIEWPEKIEQLLPDLYVRININTLNETEVRIVEIELVNNHQN